MKRLLVMLLAVVVFSIGCTGLLQPKYSFLQGIAELKTIEDKYNTTAENITAAQIQSLVSEIQQFKTKIAAMEQSNEIRALQLLADFRTNFLNSQISIILSKQYIGAGVSCANKTSSETGINYLKLFSANITNSADAAESFIKEFPSYASFTLITANTTAQFRAKAAEVSNNVMALETALRNC